MDYNWFVSTYKIIQKRQRKKYETKRDIHQEFIRNLVTKAQTIGLSTFANRWFLRNNRHIRTQVRRAFKQDRRIWNWENSPRTVARNNIIFIIHASWLRFKSSLSMGVLGGDLLRLHPTFTRAHQNSEKWPAHHSLRSAKPKRADEWSKEISWYKGSWVLAGSQKSQCDGAKLDLNQGQDQHRNQPDTLLIARPWRTVG